jgi:hypothetical protein
MYAVLVGGTEGTLTAPAGWSELPDSPLEIRSDAGGESGTLLLTAHAYTRTYAALEATSETWTWGTSVESVAYVTTYSGVDVVAAILDDVGDPTGGSTTAIDAEALNVLDDDAMRVIAYVSDTAVTFTPAVGTTERAQGDDDSHDHAIMVVDELRGIADTAPNRIASTSASQAGGSFSIALRAADVAAVAVQDDARDLYKSVLLRNTLPTTFDKRRTSTLAKFLSAIGEADNDIGGLFGKENFLTTFADVIEFYAEINCVVIEEV